MSTIRVELLDQGALERAQKLLAGMPDGIEKASKSAMSRAVSHLRSGTVKAIRERYDISASHIRANENVTVRYTYQGGVQAYITFAGGKIPLFRYGGASPGGPTPLKDRWVKVDGNWYHPGAPAHGHQLKSTAPARFDHAFVARMKSGHTGIFERDGSGLREIMGSSVPAMLGRPEVLEKLGEETAGKFRERLDHEVLRLLNGWV